MIGDPRPLRWFIRIVTLLVAGLAGILLFQSWLPLQAVSEGTRGDQPTSSSAALPLDKFRPQPMLRLRQAGVNRARYPVVDVHTHFHHRFKGSLQRLDDFVRVMDRNGIAICASLDGRLPEMLLEHQQALNEKYQDRFVVFANIDWRGDGKEDDPSSWDCQRPDFVRRTVMSLEAAAQQGASGLKIFKRFGLNYRNADGSLMRIDDPRWNPIWEACGRLGLPVIIHTADPAAFFRPIDETNERWEELSRHPDWSFYGDAFPSREELLAARNRVIDRQPQTIFIGAHLANNPEDLQTVSEWLDQYPNLYVELASRIGELGRQPYTARKFFLKHSDRILFGTDGPWLETRLRLYWRFLETFDEYFPYSEKDFPPQGFWRIYGIGLPDEVLRRVYYENASRIVPGVRQKLAKLVPQTDTKK